MGNNKSKDEQKFCSESITNELPTKWLQYAQYAGPT